MSQHLTRRISGTFCVSRSDEKSTQASNFLRFCSDEMLFFYFEFFDQIDVAFRQFDPVCCMEQRTES